MPAPDIAIPSRAPAEVSADDTVLPFEVSALDLRGRVVRLGPAVDQILEGHNYPQPVAKLLGEAIVLGMLLGTRARFLGVLGPVRRTTRMLAELGRATDPRLHAAADIGIEGPQEAALALLAEIHDALKQPLIVGLPTNDVAAAAAAA